MVKKAKTMCRLTPNQINEKLLFISDYTNAVNPAAGSSVDPNANVTMKTVATLGGELVKDFRIQINRQSAYNHIQTEFGTEIADKYIDYLEDHLIYRNDESADSPFTPYCVAISMYPLLESGTIPLGGSSSAPKHLDSFAGQYINMVYDVSAEFAGAVATAEFLLYFHYFAVKDYGENYINEVPDIVKSKFQQIIYTLNEPCAARNGQSVFFNLSVFDKFYYDSMFGNFYFPDGTHFEYESFNKLQKFFLEWLLEERTRSLLTFPVLTEASLDYEGEPKDKEWADYCADLRSRGLSFFSYNSENADSLSSCCRLRSKITDNEFSFSLGAGGVMAGSTGVITINLNRAIQYALKGYEQEELESQKEIISDYLSKLLDDVHKFHVGNRRMVEDGIAARLLPVYGKFIRLDKQYCTVGINAVNEAAEFVGCEVSNNKKYLEFISDIFKLIADKNKEAYKKYGIRFNTELIPGESVGPKFAKWDKASKLFSPRECYNSYIYLPESDTTSIPDKFIMHGYVAKSLDGGSALHLNLAGLPDKEFFLWLRTLSAKYGTNYWTTNVKQCACNSCGHIDATTHDKCPVCGSTDIDYITRIIGYAKRISSFSKERQEEESKRYYH